MARPEESADFAEFVGACGPGLLRGAWLLVGDAGRAEDLLQTALAKAWRHWSTIVQAGSPEAYVRRIIFTTYVSWWRRRWRTEIPRDPLPETIADPDLASVLAVRDAVRRALARLSRQQRAIVVLRYAEDLSVAQTAQVLGCSEGTVKVQSARALTALRSDPHLGRYSREGIEA